MKLPPYVVTVYFNGPETIWSGRVDPRHIIHQVESPWLWMARAEARSHLGNAGKCGYQIRRGGDVVEEYSPDCNESPAVPA